MIQSKRQLIELLKKKNQKIAYLEEEIFILKNTPTEKEIEEILKEPSRPIEDIIAEL